MHKCQVCQCDEVTTAWQPLGPDDSPATLMAIGWHYRGFPVIKVCTDCAVTIRRGGVIEFTYKGQRYISGDALCIAVPSYVSDPLAWFEDYTREHK